MALQAEYPMHKTARQGPLKIEDKGILPKDDDPHFKLEDSSWHSLINSRLKLHHRVMAKYCISALKVSQFIETRSLQGF
jgi:hypothetical protein